MPDERSHVREVKQIQVIQVDSLYGNGTTQSPYRILQQFFDQKGNLLAQHDSKNDR